jgi:hypothetical protein
MSFRTAPTARDRPQLDYTPLHPSATPSYYPTMPPSQFCGYALSDGVPPRRIASPYLYCIGLRYTKNWTPTRCFSSFTTNKDRGSSSLQLNSSKARLEQRGCEGCGVFWCVVVCCGVLCCVVLCCVVLCCVVLWARCVGIVGWDAMDGNGVGDALWRGDVAPSLPHCPLSCPSHAVMAIPQTLPNVVPAA